jgi:hypothetical protein
MEHDVSIPSIASCWAPEFFELHTVPQSDDEAVFIRDDGGYRIRLKRVTRTVGWRTVVRLMSYLNDDDGEHFCVKAPVDVEFPIERAVRSCFACALYDIDERERRAARAARARRPA